MTRRTIQVHPETSILGNPFKSSNIASPRLVWDHSVHQSFGEDCIYCLLRASQPDSRLVETLERRLTEAQITSSCVYLIFGQWDILIRMWGTPSKAKRFVKLVREDTSYIEESDVFNVDDIVYMWADRQSDRSSIGQFRECIESVCREADTTGLSFSDNRLHRLREAGLIHQLQQAYPTCVKFYIALEQPSGDSMNRVVQSELQMFVTRGDLGLQNVSIYCGKGFARYLIKAVVKNYDGVSRCVRALLDHTLLRHLRSTTYLIADRNPNESDHIDIYWNEPYGRLVDLESLLGLDFPVPLGKATGQLQHEFNQLMERYHTLSGTRFHPYFRDIFAAALCTDNSALGRGMLFILQMEELLRSYLVKTCSQFIGNSWYNAVRQAAQECGITAENPTKDYTLHDVSTMLQKLVSKDLIPRSEVDQVFGADWGKRLSQLREYRNAMAHGRVFSNEAYVGREWFQLADTMFSVGNIYNALLVGVERGRYGG
jgi:hypothetical protein